MSLPLMLWTALAWPEETLDSVDVQFWPPPGIYTNFVGVMLVAAKGRPRYTLDRTDPQPGSVGYWDPILITADTTVLACAFDREQSLGPIAAATYRIATNALFEPALPLVIVNSLGQPIGTKERVPAMISILGSEPGRRGLRGPVHYSGRGAVALRGSSSRGMPKKPYRIELQDGEGNDLKASLLGMPKESDWILLASHTDRTFVRDPLAYELWRQMGHYAPRWRYVELFVARGDNATALVEPADYQGVYLLVEKIKRGKSRVAIHNLAAKDNAEPAITGGYIFKKDRPNPGEAGLTTTRLGLQFVIEEPKEREMTAAQRQWLQEYLDGLEAALLSPALGDRRQGYRAFIDPLSFIDYHWLAEMSANPDGYAYSIFFHKDREGKLTMGPIWDSDLAFGNLVSHGRFQVEGWQWQRQKHPLYQWYDRLFEDPDFLQDYIDRWHQLRQGPFQTARVLELIDTLAAGVAGAPQAWNFQRWPSLNAAVQANRVLGVSHTAQVQKLKEWVRGRLEWIDSQCFPPPALELIQERLVCSADLGSVYFTTDGSDPRQEGGRPSSRALRYDQPVAAQAGVVVMARTLSPFGLWSAPARLDCTTKKEL